MTLYRTSTTLILVGLLQLSIALYLKLDSFPGLPCLSVLRFALTIIHGCGRVEKNVFRRPSASVHALLSTQTKEQKKGVGLGTRLI